MSYVLNPDFDLQVPCGVCLSRLFALEKSGSYRSVFATVATPFGFAVVGLYCRFRWLHLTVSPIAGLHSSLTFNAQTSEDWIRNSIRARSDFVTL